MSCRLRQQFASTAAAAQQFTVRFTAPYTGLIPHGVLYDRRHGYGFG